MSHGCVAWQRLVSVQWIILTVICLSECFVLDLNSTSALADIELKEAQRFFAQTFSCGASVTAEDEIVIQGDFTDDIIEVIQEKWPEVRALKFSILLWFVLTKHKGPQSQTVMGLLH